MEADSGYCGHPRYIKCPENGANPPENLAMQAHVQSRHDSFNGRLKNWGNLKQVFRHNILLHGPVFRVCAVLTQLMVENGELLFLVEYSDSA